MVMSEQRCAAKFVGLLLLADLLQLKFGVLAVVVLRCAAAVAVFQVILELTLRKLSV